MPRPFRVRAALVTALLLVSSITPIPVAAAEPTTTVIDILPANPTINVQVCFQATTTVTAGGGWVTSGNVHIYETTSGSDVFVVAVVFDFGQPSTGTACVPAGLSTVGAHSFRGDYSDVTTQNEPSSDTLDVEVGKATPDWDVWTTPASPETGSPVELAASFADNGVDEQGTLAIYRNGIASPICTAGPTNNDFVFCTVTAWAPGTYQLTATNSGSTSVEASTTAPLTVVVVPNTVHASGVTTQYTTFYPYKDAYKDTVAIKGVRNEKIGVTIKIYSPTGTLRKTVTIASGTGAYSYAWNGRNSAGTIYAAGKYKVVQTLKDALGTTKTYTSYVNLSRKRLIWHSSSVTKKGSSYNASGHSGGGSVARNTTSGYVRLRAPEYYYDWAGAGWEFTLPTAVVYKGITVRIYAKHGWVAGPATRLGSQNFTTCAYVASGNWNESCFDTWKDIGNNSGALAWYSTTTLSSAHRSGTKVRSSVSDPAGTIYVYLARVSFQYATLGY